MDNQERETMELELPISKLRVVYCKYITAREAMHLTEVKGVNESNKYLFDTLVKKIGDAETELYNLALDLCFQDYKTIDKALANLINPEEEEKKV